MDLFRGAAFPRRGRGWLRLDGLAGPSVKGYVKGGYTAGVRVLRETKTRAGRWLAKLGYESFDFIGFLRAKVSKIIEISK